MIENAYNKIKAVIEHGQIAIVKFDNGSIFTFYEIDDEGIECNEDYFTEKQINDENITKITPIPRPFKKLKVGDKVIILENLRDIAKFKDWTKECREMVSNVFRVEGVFNSYDGVYYEINGYHFPHNCVAPYFEDDERKEVCEDDMYKIDDKIYTKDEIKKALEFVNKFKEVNECLSNN